MHHPAFLPTTRAELQALGWDEVDVLLVTGDAYVDHPSFGAALLGRWLVEHGFRVGIVAQPRWNTTEDVARLGRPRLFAGITAGALDSMLAHHTAFRRKRADDAFTPGGRAGARPNRAVTVYTNLLRQAFPGLRLVLGGIEASLRRISHYDFWTDSLHRPLLCEARADLLVYGMGERAILEAARNWRQGIPGTAWLGQEHGGMQLPSHEDVAKDRRLLMKATLDLERHVQAGSEYAAQRVGRRTLVLAPPAEPLSTQELDLLYGLPFTRRPHPSYREPIPAAEMIRWSVNTHRGCGGGCSFCSLALHQGRRVASRSRESILQEVRAMASQPGWKGAISDVGGPTANMWKARCTLDPARCQRASCLHPTVCRGFACDQGESVGLLRAVAGLPGVRSVRVASGVRYDLALQDPRALRAYTGEFTGGQLKVAPEHTSEPVLQLMRKPGPRVFEEFLRAFERDSRGAGKEQYVVPYLISAFPGCTDEDMRGLSRWLRRRGWSPQQVQCFIPTPGTAATAMFYAGIDPRGNPIPVARTDAERRRQHDLLTASPASRGDARRR